MAKKYSLKFLLSLQKHILKEKNLVSHKFFEISQIQQPGGISFVFHLFEVIARNGIRELTYTFK